MDVQQLPISKFLKTANSLIIPVYQRDYAWKIQHCEKLWMDVKKLISNENESHFLGTIVTINDGYGKYLVIDGQQRLTTISIFLIALIHYLKEKKIKSDDENQLQRVLKSYIIDEESISSDTKIKLKPNKSDLEFFEDLFDGNQVIENESNITNNYFYFKKEFKKEELTPFVIFEKGLKRLKIVSIDLNRGQDDPQLIFESLNSTGVDLTAGDLIRNYILMDLEPDKQEKLYKQYWVEIENLSGDIAEFIRNYLIFKQKKWIKKADVYSIFKKHSFDTFGKDKEAILDDLLIFVEMYSWFIQIKDYKNKKINEKLARLNKLEFTICHPYLFDVFYDVKIEDIDENVVIEILTIVESYAFRKILVDNSTQGLNKMFTALSKEIKKEDSWKEQYVNILNYILLEKRVSQRVPNDDEFENALIYKEIYRLQSKNKNFLLESLENHNSAYSIQMDELTIEHIMPQKLTREWKNKLGENWQEVHTKYLHTLGNLSLTAKNSKLSNNSFENKQRIDFQTSKLRLNYKLGNQTEWNEKTILERAKNLIKDAKKIWVYPKTTYSKSVIDKQTFDLESEDDFSGSKPSRLFFENDELGIELKTWRDLLLKTCNLLYNFSPTEFIKVETSEEFKGLFGIDKTLPNALEFVEGHFMNVRFSANDSIKILKKICERMNYPADRVVFSLKNTKIQKNF